MSAQRNVLPTSRAIFEEAGSSPDEIVSVITVVQFAGVDEAIALDSSPACTALKPLRDKSANWRSYVVEGVRK